MNKDGSEVRMLTSLNSRYPRYHQQRFAFSSAVCCHKIDIANTTTAITIILLFSCDSPSYQRLKQVKQRELYRYGINFPPPLHFGSFLPWLLDQCQPWIGRFEFFLRPFVSLVLHGVCGLFGKQTSNMNRLVLDLSRKNQRRIPSISPRVEGSLNPN